MSLVCDKRSAATPADAAWFVAYTTPQGERLLKEDLVDAGYQVFLPLVRRVHRPARHRRNQARRVIERPLFPRYLFVGLDPRFRDFDPVRANKRIVELLSDPRGNPVEIPYTVIEAMQGDVEVEDDDAAAIRMAQFLGIYGRQVRIESGPFRDLIATVVRASRKEISLDVHGQGATLRLNVPILDCDVSVLSYPQDDQQKRSASSVG